MQNTAIASETKPSDRCQARGSCLCGSVIFEVRGPLRPVVYCHCTMCRRSGGHFMAATACNVAALHLLRSESLRWYQSSPAAQRGFCAECGSNLFWRPADGDYISIWAGSLDKPTGLVAREHIFVAHAGDYYRIQDGLPQSPEWGPPLEAPNP